MLPKEIILNASYEAYLIPEFKKGFLSIYTSFTSLYEKVKFTNKEIQNVTGRLFLSDNSEITRIAQVISISLKNNETKEQVLELLEKELSRLVKKNKCYKEDKVAGVVEYDMSSIATICSNLSILYYVLKDDSKLQLPSPESKRNESFHIKNSLATIYNGGEKTLNYYNDSQADTAIKTYLATYKSDWEHYNAFVDVATTFFSENSDLTYSIALGPLTLSFLGSNPYERTTSFAFTQPCLDKFTFSSAPPTHKTKNKMERIVDNFRLSTSDSFAEFLEEYDEEDTEDANLYDIFSLAIRRFFVPLYIKGFDGFHIMTYSPISPKNVRAAVNEAFVLFNKTGNRFPKTPVELLSLAESVVRILYLEQLAKYSQSLSSNKADASIKTSAIDKANKKRLSEALNENQILKAELKKSEDKVIQSIKEYKDENKALRSEVRELQKIIEELTAPENPEEEIIIETIDDQIEKAKEEKIDINVIVQNNNILVWGPREDTARKIKEKFPFLTVVDSNTDVSSQRLKNYDGAIIYTHATGHSKYYAFMSSVKIAGIPRIQIRKDACNMLHLEEALKRISSFIPANKMA